MSKSKDHVSLQYDPDADTPQMVEAVAVAACAESDREAKLIFRETSKAFGYNYAHYICQPE